MAHPRIKIIKNDSADASEIRNHLAKLGYDIDIISSGDIAAESNSHKQRYDQEFQALDNKADGLARLARNISSHLNVQNIVELICQESVRIFNASWAAIFLYNEKLQQLELAYALTIPGLDSGAISTLSRKEYDQVIQPPATTAWFPDLTQLPDCTFLAGLGQHGYQSMVIGSMHFQENLVGALLVAAENNTQPSLNEVPGLLQAITNQAANAIVSARLYQETQQRNRYLETLARISTTLRKAGTQQEMLPILVQETKAAFQADSGLIYQFEEWEEISSFSLGSEQEVLRSLFSPEGVYWQQLQQEPVWYLAELVNIHSRDQSDPGEAGFPGLVSAVCVQLRAVQTVVGILVLGFRRNIEPTETDRQTLLSIAEMGGNALQRSGVMEMLEKRVRDRTRELVTLYEISVLTSQSMNLNDVLESSLQKIITTLMANGAAIYQVEPSSKTLALIVQSGIAVNTLSRIRNLPLTKNLQKWLYREAAPRLESSLIKGKSPHLITFPEYSFKILVPVRIQNVVFGILVVLWREAQELAVENIALLTAIAERMSTAIHASDLRKLAEKTAVYEERQRLARDLHDSVSQSIYSLTLLAESAKDLARMGDTNRLHVRLSELSASSLQALREMRLLLYELRQSLPEELDFLVAIQKRLEGVEHRAGIETSLIADAEIVLSPAMQKQLYQIANEALNNSLKYARASAVTVKLQRSPKGIVLEISDNGIGFDTHTARGFGMGLSTMDERVKGLGGRLNIISEPNQGTTVHVELSLDEGKP